MVSAELSFLKPAWLNHSCLSRVSLNLKMIMGQNILLEIERSIILRPLLQRFRPPFLGSFTG